MNTIYLAEDHVAIRELLCMHPRLAELFVVVGQTGRGSTAICECLKLQPDLLLLDLNLAELSGFEVLKSLSESECATKILVFSCSSDAATIGRVVDLGARGFVEKTAPFDTLERAMSAVASGDFFFTAAASRFLQQEQGQSGLDSSKLTSRETETLKLVANGFSNKEMAAALSLSVKTIESHRHSLMRKLGARNAADLAREAYRRGFLSP
jgi:DNA-binding NarL/FixJ family response regulator